MNNSLKIFFIAVYIIVVGFIAAHNAKWIREGTSPWWTTYIISFFTSTAYAYLARHPFFPMTYTSVFQTFFFHGAWYCTTIFVIGEHINRFQAAGLSMAFVGMLLMGVK